MVEGEAESALAPLQEPEVVFSGSKLYRTVGERVLMHGAEANFDWHLAEPWKVAGTLSYVRGRLIDLNDEPLPRLPPLPPLQGHLGLTCEPTEALSATVDLRLAAEQNRIGEFEKPTEGYAVLDFSSQYYAEWGGVCILSL